MSVARQHRPGPREPRDERIVLRVGRRFMILMQRDISWIEADGNYVVIHADARSVRARATLGVVREMLGPAFAQVHRSALVNLDHLVELHSEPHGDLLLLLRNGARVRGSRQFRGEVHRFMTRGGPQVAALGRTA